MWNDAMICFARVRNYWREEFFLIGVLFLFFSAIVALSFNAPFDARLFPIVIGTTGIALTVIIGVEQLRRRRTGDTPVREDDPAAKSGWLRLTTALLSAPVFGLLLWLLGFVAASLVAMVLMPPLMGYRDRARQMVVAVAAVAILAFVAPHLLGIDVPHGLVGDWLIDKLALRPG